MCDRHHNEKIVGTVCDEDFCAKCSQEWLDELPTFKNGNKKLTFTLDMAGKKMWRLT